MQQNFNYPQLPTTDLFTTQFDTFQQTALFQQLQKKYTPTPYYSKYRALRWIALIASYLFNTFSGLTASTLVFFFVQSLTGTVYVSAFCTVLFIVLIEVAKRKTNGVLFKDYLQYKQLSKGLLFAVLLLLSLSVTFSYYGSKKVVTTFHTPPTLAQTDTVTNPLKDELTAIENQIKQARATRWNGTTTTTSQRTIETLTRQKLAIQNRLFEVEAQTETDNRATLTTHQKAVYLKAENFAFVTLFLELLFILCAFYVEYYDYRSFAEFAKPNNNDHNPKPLQPNNGRHITQKTNTNFDDTSNYKPLQSKPITPDQLNTDDNTDPKKGISNDAIQKAMKYAKGRISTYQYRLRNNIGRTETAMQNIAHWTGELNNLKEQIQ